MTMLTRQGHLHRDGHAKRNLDARKYRVQQRVDEQRARRRVDHTSSFLPQQGRDEPAEECPLQRTERRTRQTGRQLVSLSKGFRVQDITPATLRQVARDCAILLASLEADRGELCRWFRLQTQASKMWPSRGPERTSGRPNAGPSRRAREQIRLAVLHPHTVGAH